MHRGEFLIVKDFKGRPLIRRLWDIGDGVVFIVNEEQYRLLIKNDPGAAGPIGFPKKDVFKYDAKLGASLDSLIKNYQWDWGKLEPYE